MSCSNVINQQKGVLVSDCLFFSFFSVLNMIYNLAPLKPEAVKLGTDITRSAVISSCVYCLRCGLQFPKFS